MAEEKAHNSMESLEHKEHQDPQANYGVDGLQLTHEEAQLAAESSENFKWDLPLFLNLLALLFCYFASTWGLLVPSSSIPFLIQAFPSEASKAAWIAAAATIPNCVVQAFDGELSDILGRKIFLLGGMVLGFIGSIVSSRGTSVSMIIAGQVLNGCGLTLGYLAIPLVAEIVPKRKRPIIQAFAGIASGLAITIGPVAQGAFIKNNVGGQHEGWRVGFYLQAGFYALTCAMLLAFYHPAARPTQETSTWSRILHIDWIGVFLVAAGITLFLVGLQYGGNPYSWTSAMVLCTMTIGGLGLVVFGVWEWKGTKTGLFHHRLFEHRNFIICVVLNVVTGIVFFGGQAYLPQEIAYLFTHDAVLTGCYNMPFNGGTIVGGIIVGVLMNIGFEARPIAIGSYVIFLIANGLMAIMEPHINFAAWFFPTIMLGIAVGMQLSVLIIAVGLCSPNMLIATAVSLVGAIRGLGGSVGIVIFSQIFQHKVADKWAPQVSSALIEAGLPPTELEEFLLAASQGATSLLIKMPGVTPAILEAFERASRQAYADCFRFIWYALLPFSVLSLALAFWLKPTRPQMTDQVAAGVKRGRTTTEQ